MKHLLLIFTVFVLTYTVNAQGTQTEDEVYVGKGKTFGKYNGTGIIIPDFDRKEKQTTVPRLITGVVMSVSIGREDTLTDKRGFNFITLRKDDGTIVTIGTRDNAFTIPRTIVGRTITIDGSLVAGGRKRRGQQEIQYAATGIKVLD